MIDVSVVIPVYNTHAPWVREAVESVLSQRGPSFELVLVNDGSDNEDTLDELERARLAVGNQTVTLLSEMPQNCGVGAAMRHGLQLARGKYVALLGSDDVMLPNRLAYQYRLLEEGGYHLVSGQVQFANAAGEVRGESSFQGRLAQAWPKRVLDPTVTFLREDALAVGSFDVRRRIAEATDLWYRWQEHHGTSRVFVSKELVTVYRLHAGSLSYGKRGAKHLQRWRTG